ncbi:MAG: hydroxymethylglutaryl-CoA lyase [Candidatus Marinimicrobia bacterium]|nr:hydroxymethylglutaryl-CoA lyase [Candidatus Neomarinimicrobiota bacterium]
MYPTKVEVTEVGTRDGFQNEKIFIPTEKKIDLINKIVASGVRRIEATAFVSPRAVPQLVDASEVIAGINRVPSLRIACLVPNHQGLARAIAAEVDEVVAFCSVTESHNQTNLNRSIEESIEGFESIMKSAEKTHIAVHGALAVAFGCPFEGDVDPSHVASLVNQLYAIGIRNITLGDTTGMATPPLVDRVVKTIQDKMPDVKISLHFHNTRGIGLVNVLAGLSAGISRYESSIGGIGGCPFAPGASGNICSEDLVYMLGEYGIDTGVDLLSLMHCAHQLQGILGRALPGQVMKAGLRTRTFPLSAVKRATR